MLSGSGKLHRRWPHNRCDGVSGSSISSVNTYVMGNKFKVISTSAMIVSNSS